MSITDGSLLLAGGAGTEGLASKQSTWNNVLSTACHPASDGGHYLTLSSEAATCYLRPQFSTETDLLSAVAWDADSRSSSGYGSREPKYQAALNCGWAQWRDLYPKSVCSDESIL